MRVARGGRVGVLGDGEGDGGEGDGFAEKPAYALLFGSVRLGVVGTRRRGEVGARTSWRRGSGSSERVLFWCRGWVNFLIAVDVWGQGRRESVVYHDPLSRQIFERDFWGSGHCSSSCELS